MRRNHAYDFKTALEDTGSIMICGETGRHADWP